MSNKKKLKTTLLALLILILASFFIFRHMFPFLATTDRKHADVLVIEGWIHKYNLRLAMKEFQQHSYKEIVTASILLPAEFEMYSKGGLIFDLTENQQVVPKNVKQITVNAYGTALDDEFAHFKLIANDSVVGEATTGPTLAPYSFDLSLFPEPVRQITIKFDNDGHTQQEDRNLYVHSLIVDEQTLPARSPYVVYDRKKIDGKILVRTDLFSEAEEAREFLIQEGLPDSLITVLNAPEVQFDKTYTSALTVRKWMKKQYTDFPAFNIFTESAHARRTRMLYDLAFEGQTEIGIIASPSQNFSQKNWWKKRAGRRFVIEQALKYLYAKFLFYPSRMLATDTHIENQI